MRRQAQTTTNWCMNLNIGVSTDHTGSKKTKTKNQRKIIKKKIEIKTPSKLDEASVLPPAGPRPQILMTCRTRSHHPQDQHPEPHTVYMAPRKSSLGYPCDQQCHVPLIRVPSFTYLTISILGGEISQQWRLPDVPIIFQVSPGAFQKNTKVKANSRNAMPLTSMTPDGFPPNVQITPDNRASHRRQCQSAHLASRRVPSQIVNPQKEKPTQEKIQDTHVTQLYTAIHTRSHSDLNKEKKSNT